MKVKGLIKILQKFKKGRDVEGLIPAGKNIWSLGRINVRQDIKEDIVEIEIIPYPTTTKPINKKTWRKA